MLAVPDSDKAACGPHRKGPAEGWSTAEPPALGKVDPSFRSAGPSLILVDEYRTSQKGALRFSGHSGSLRHTSHLDSTLACAPQAGGPNLCGEDWEEVVPHLLQRGSDGKERQPHLQTPRPSRPAVGVPHTAPHAVLPRSGGSQRDTVPWKSTGFSVGGFIPPPVGGPRTP